METNELTEMYQTMVLTTIRAVSLVTRLPTTSLIRDVLDPSVDEESPASVMAFSLDTKLDMTCEVIVINGRVKNRVQNQPILTKY